MLVFAMAEDRQCVGAGFAAASFPTPGEPRREHNAPDGGADGRRPCGVAIITAAGAAGRRVMRPSAAVRPHVRDLHALLPAF
ncbi:MAG TPA: hypothetical protein VIL71_07575 [Spirillospora sp.]